MEIPSNAATRYIRFYIYYINISQTVLKMMLIKKSQSCTINMLSFQAAHPTTSLMTSMMVLSTAQSPKESIALSTVVKTKWSLAEKLSPIAIPTKSHVP